MKKIFILLFMLFNCLCAHADVMPYYVTSINSASIGLYQATNNVKVYKEPNEKAPLLLEANWDFKNYDCAQVSVSNLFVVFIQPKELAFLLVTDETDEWVEVIYNRSTAQKGWVKKNDPYMYLPWISFYNSYGRKYGFYILKDAPEITKALYSSPIETSQVLNRINMPQKIKLNAIRGNWALVSVMDMDKMPKTGFLQWRNKDGEIYVFPAIK